MDDQNAWIEERLTDAVDAATTKAHVFPKAVIADLAKLLSDALQEPRKPAELDEIASSLISANRSVA